MKIQDIVTDIEKQNIELAHARALIVEVCSYLDNAEPNYISTLRVIGLLSYSEDIITRTENSFDAIGLELEKVLDDFSEK